MNGDLSYDSHDLQTYDPDTGRGILTNVIEHTNVPDKIAELYAKADANGSSIPAINYPSKKVVIGGVIKGVDQIVSNVVAVTAQQDLDNLIDTFKGYFNVKDKNLDITYGTGTRRYIATPNTISVVRQQKAAFATFHIEFVCTTPFGLDTSATTFINQQNRTTASYTATPTIGGTAPYQLPVFTITIDAHTGAGDYLQISNDDNNQEILLYGLGLANGDVIVIDCLNRTVTRNGTDVDYNGTFLELVPGLNSITYSDGFTTRTVDIVASYYKRWL